MTREQFTDGVASGRSDATGRYARQDWFLIQRLNGRIGRDQLALRASLSGSDGTGRYETRSSSGTQLETSTQQRQSWQLGGDWTRRLAVGKLETSLSGNSQNEDQQRQGSTSYAEDRRESTWLLKSKLSGARSESLLWMAGLEHETLAHALVQLE